MNATDIRVTIRRPDGSVYDSKVIEGVTSITQQPHQIDGEGSDGLMLWWNREVLTGWWAYPFSGYTLELEAA